jgi:hypothetical protein
MLKSNYLPAGLACGGEYSVKDTACLIQTLKPLPTRTVDFCLGEPESGV